MEASQVFEEAQLEYQKLTGYEICSYSSPEKAGEFIAWTAKWLCQKVCDLEAQAEDNEALTMAWKSASGLEVGGDPEDVTPEMCENNISKFTARVAELEATLEEVESLSMKELRASLKESKGKIVELQSVLGRLGQ